MQEQNATIILEDVETGESVELYLLEETTLAGKHYLLMAEDPEGDSEAYLFRQEGEDEENITYIPVEDDQEYSAISKLFEELMEDVDFER